jgi:hypothetical protein
LVPSLSNCSFQFVTISAPYSMSNINGLDDVFNGIRTTRLVNAGQG